MQIPFWPAPTVPPSDQCKIVELGFTPDGEVQEPCFRPAIGFMLDALTGEAVQVCYKHLSELMMLVSPELVN